MAQRTTHAARHVTCMRKTRRQRDLSHASPSLEQQHSRTLHPPLHDKSMHRHSGGFPEKRFEMREAETGDARKLGKCEVLIEVSLDVFDHLPQAPRR